MSKEIHFKITHGKVDLSAASNKGSVDFQTGSIAANQLIGELNGRFGKQLNDRPTIVIPFENESNAEEFKNFFSTF